VLNGKLYGETIANLDWTVDARLCCRALKIDHFLRVVRAEN